VRKGLLTLVCAGVALAAPLLMPGSALAASPLQITTSPTSAGVAGGANDCTFTANLSGENVDVADIETCLTDTHPVTVDDNAGGAIDVEDPISDAGCSGTSLSLNEQDSGPVDITESIDIGTCSLALDGPSAITESEAETITAGTVNVDSTGNVDLSQNIANANVFQTLTGAVSGTLNVFDTVALDIGALTGGSQSLSVDTDGDIVVSGAVSDAATVSLTANANPSAITEASSGSVDVPTLDATGRTGVTLTGSSTGNQVSTFEGISASGSVNLTDDATGVLTLDGAQGFTVNITNTGSINSAGSVQASGQDASLVSQDGSVSADNGFDVGQLTVSGTSVSLAGDSVSTLIATASAGAISASLFDPDTTLGNVEATGGSVSVDNSDGALDLAGTISGQSIALSADGFEAGGPTGLLSAPDVSITDSDTSDAWTVTPNSVTALGEAIAYSGASSLSIGGGAKTFNVTPSTSTAMSFNGGSPAAGTLNYNANGGTVSGTTSPTSGTIFNSGFEPVAFSGMSAVNVTNAATPPSSSGSTGTGGSSGTGSTPTKQPSPNAPTCTLRASSSKVALPKRVHGKLNGKATLTLIADCTGAVHTTLNGAFTVTVKPAHKKAKSKSYGLKTIKTTLSAGLSTKIVVDVPSAIVKALSTKGDKLSAGFTLADSDDHDDVLMDDNVKRLT